MKYFAVQSLKTVFRFYIIVNYSGLVCKWSPKRLFEEDDQENDNVEGDVT